MQQSPEALFHPSGTIGLLLPTERRPSKGPSALFKRLHLCFTGRELNTLHRAHKRAEQQHGKSEWNSNQVFEGNAFNAESVTSVWWPWSTFGENKRCRFCRGSAVWAAILEIVCYLATQLASEASASKLLRLPEITVLTITNGKLWREICQKLLRHNHFLSKINFHCKTYAVYIRP